MKREEAQAWLAVVLEVREQPLVRPDDAVELCERLEEAGWDTSPLGAVDLLDMVARMTLKKG
jgi:hypothetical protein